MKQNPLLSINLTIITVSLVIYILYIGGVLIIPFVIALLFSFAIISISSFFKKKGLNRFFSFTFSLLTFSLLIFTIGYIINTNISDLLTRAPFYQERFLDLSTQILQKLESITFLKINDAFIEEKIIKNIDIPNVFSYVASSITSIISFTGIVFFYIVFILLEYRYFGDKLNLIFGTRISKDKALDIINRIKNDVRSYFFIKTVISLVKALLSYFILKMFSIDFALFWSFLIFILNFIPNVGSFFAFGLPLVFAFIILGFGYSLLGLFVALMTIELLISNVMEPKLMGNRLNLSSLVIVISLGFWGMIWGVVGMLLSVPIMVIINIILSNINSTKSIAILLSEKGYINTDFGNIEKENDLFFSKMKMKIRKIIR